MSFTVKNPKVVAPRSLSEAEVRRIRREAREQVRAEERTLIRRQMQVRPAS
ncbi:MULTISPECIES: hypothetical protein [Desertihabitans]|uniref:hypothetical protein n=1 Tax=Desertihabitans TaxID=2676837 RepID=UPI001300663E|nr:MULTISPECIES: hypothetical protein [Desertihabitans]